MKILLTRILFLFLILSNCKNKTSYFSEPHSKKNSEEMVKTVSEFDKKIDSSELNLKSKSNKLSFSKNTAIYEYNRENSKQRIKLNFISNDSISYFLKTETSTCNAEFHGRAFNPNLGMDPEIDEDEQGLSYPSAEYFDFSEDYTISIRLALDSTKVKISYTKKNKSESNCNPNTDIIMKKTK